MSSLEFWRANASLRLGFLELAEGALHRASLFVCGVGGHCSRPCPVSSGPRRRRRAPGCAAARRPGGCSTRASVVRGQVVTAAVEPAGNRRGAVAADRSGEDRSTTCSRAGTCTRGDRRDPDRGRAGPGPGDPTARRSHGGGACTRDRGAQPRVEGRLGQPPAPGIGHGASAVGGSTHRSRPGRHPASVRPPTSGSPRSRPAATTRPGTSSAVRRRSRLRSCAVRPSRTAKPPTRGAARALGEARARSCGLRGRRTRRRASERSGGRDEARVLDDHADRPGRHGRAGVRCLPRVVFRRAAAAASSSRGAASGIASRSGSGHYEAAPGSSPPARPRPDPWHFGPV